MASTRRWKAAGLATAMCAATPWLAAADTSGAPLLDDPTLIALAVALACADAPESAPMSAPLPREPAPGGPDLELVASVRAKTLRFDEVPTVDVIFRGNTSRRTVWRTERVNLPARPEPGVVYRDVQLRLTISTDVENLGEMLGQAKRAAKGVRVEQDAARPPPTERPARDVELATTARDLSREAGEPDVLLDAGASVDLVEFVVRNLRAHVALDARVANLVQLSAGADASIDEIRLTIREVRVEAHLVVRLDNVTRIVDRALTTLDRNPQIVASLLTTVDRTVQTVGRVADTALQPGGVVSQTIGTVGQVANTALQPGGVVDKAVTAVGTTLVQVTAPNGLLAQTVNTLGQTVQRTVDATGRIVERTLDQTGKLVGEQDVGSVLELPALFSTTDAAGRTVRAVRDASGMLIQFALDEGGNVSDVGLLRSLPVLTPDGPAGSGAQPVPASGSAPAAPALVPVAPVR